MRHLWLIAALMFLVLGIIGLLVLQGETSNPSTATAQATATPPPSSTPISLPPPAVIPATPVPEATPEPPPPPTPVPLPPFSIKQTGNSEWRVILPAGGWYDTGVPVVIGDRFNVESIDGKGKWMTRFDGHVSFPWNPVGGGGLYQYFLVMEMNDGTGPAYIATDPTFGRTVELQVDDEGKEQVLRLRVWVEDSHVRSCDHWTEHQAQHQQARAWAEAMKAKLARQ